METRVFERSKWFVIALVAALTVLLFVGLFRAMAAPPEVPPERPAAALYSVTWNTTVMTQATNATAVTTQNFAYQDVGCSFDFYNNQRVTVTLQASLDNSNWFQTHSFTAITTDTTVLTGIFSRTLSLGRYERMVFGVMTAYEVTPTCKSVFFNNWMPFDNVVTGGRAVPE